MCARTAGAPPSGAIRGRASAPRGIRDSNLSPESHSRWTRGRTGRYAADASPGPARDAPPGAPAAGTMGAAHSASEEVRELMGKTGCEYSSGDGRGDTDGYRSPAGVGAPKPPPPARLRSTVLCDLGLVAGPLCLSLPVLQMGACRPLCRLWRGVSRLLSLGTHRIGRKPPDLRTTDPGTSRARAPPGPAPGLGESAPGRSSAGDAQLVRAPHLKAFWIHDAQGAESFEVGGRWVGAGLWLRPPTCKMG